MKEIKMEKIKNRIIKIKNKIKNRIKKNKNRIKNTILKTLAYIMGVILFLSMSALDSESLIPFCLTCISGTYLAIYAYANKERFGLTR